MFKRISVKPRLVVLAAILATHLFFVPQSSFTASPILLYSQSPLVGVISCILNIPGSAGMIRFELFTEEKHKLFEKEIALKPKNEYEKFLLFWGSKPGTKYIVRAQGQLVAVDSEGAPSKPQDYQEERVIETNPKGDALTIFTKS